MTARAAGQVSAFTLKDHTSDVSAFTAATVVVESEDEDSDNTIEHDLMRLEQQSSDIASSEVADDDMYSLDKLEEEWSDDGLGKSVEKKDEAETNFLQALQAQAGAMLDSARSKLGNGPVAMLGIGLMLMLTAFMIMCLCTNMQKSGGFNGFSGNYSQYEHLEGNAGPGGMEVWERRAIECPFKAREIRITKLFHELRANSQGAKDGSITASDLHDLMRDPRVAAEFADIGIHTFHDAMPAYKMLASKSPDGVTVSLVDFVNVSTSPEGQLIQLFTELDESSQCDDSPPGYVNEEDLHHMMGDERVQAKFMQLGLSAEDAFAVFRVIETRSGSGLVSIEEFVPGCTKMKSRQRRGMATRSTASGGSGSGHGSRGPMGGVI